MRTAALPGAGYNFILSITVNIPRRDGYSSAKSGSIGEQFYNSRAGVFIAADKRKRTAAGSGYDCARLPGLCRAKRRQQIKPSGSELSRKGCIHRIYRRRALPQCVNHFRGRRMRPDGTNQSGGAGNDRRGYRRPRPQTGGGIGKIRTARFIHRNAWNIFSGRNDIHAAPIIGKICFPITLVRRSNTDDPVLAGRPVMTCRVHRQTVQISPKPVR